MGLALNQRGYFQPETVDNEQKKQPKGLLIIYGVIYILFHNNKLRPSVQLMLCVRTFHPIGAVIDEFCLPQTFTAQPIFGNPFFDHVLDRGLGTFLGQLKVIEVLAPVSV